MNTDPRLSCYVIGNEDITLQCAKVILEKNYRLQGVVSLLSKIKTWCLKNNIPYFDTIQKLESTSIHKKFDFLLSIGNRDVLSSALLQAPRVSAINYHNGPLPQYAGLYPTSWAIYYGERRHAITWHVMNDKLDAGAILKQIWFSIDENETALSLNLKCYEHAFESFPILLEELATNKTTIINQLLASRSYFGLKNKPTDLGFISWNETGEYIDALCRAFYLGGFLNEIASPKVIINDKVFIVASHKKVTPSSHKSYGKIVNLSEDGLQITTKTVDILITHLVDLNGEKQNISQLGLVINQRLPAIADTYLQKLFQSGFLNANIEKFWVNKQLQCIPDKLFFFSNTTALSNEKRPDCIQTFCQQRLTKLKAFSTEHKVDPKHVILTSILIYLFQHNQYKNFSIQYHHPDLIRRVGDLSNFLAAAIPLTTQFDSQQTFREALFAVVSDERKLASYGSYCRDLFFRYPELHHLTAEIEVGIIFCETKEAIGNGSGSKLNIYVSENCDWLSMHALIYGHNANEHIFHLFDEMISNPCKKIPEYSYLTEQEKGCLLHDWNHTSLPYPHDKTITELFEEQVNRTPYDIAVVFENQQLTYESLNQRANQVAHLIRMRYQGLTQHQLAPDTVIPICVDRSIEMVVGILAILKAGGAYVPIDPMWPDGRIKYVLEDTKAQIGLTEGALVQRLRLLASSSLIQSLQGLSTNRFGEIKDKQASSKKWIVLDDVICDGHSSHNLNPIHTQHDLAYVIYTSGSTGRPKGVMNIHQALVNRLHWMQRCFQLTAADRVLQKTVFTFDVSVWELLWPLLNGAGLVVASSGAHHDPANILQVMVQHRVTVAHFVPSMLELFLMQEGLSNALHQLKYIICSGEALSWSLKERCLKQLSVGLYNLYGPTESAIDVSYWDCREDIHRCIVPIGRPIDNVTLYVLDEYLKPLPIDVIGELYIGGDGLARGYLNNPVLTAEKFIANPFSNIPGDRLYRTGDLVRRLPNGCLEYIGRTDFQVKIRGFRIELGEIESVFNQIPGVQQSYAMVHYKEEVLADKKLLVIYYTASESIAEMKILAVLIKQLPDYMIPHSFMYLEKFPLTESGKVDRKLLPAPVFNRHISKRQKPRNDIERAIYSIWKQILGRKTISIQDDFFRIGGDSLLSIQLASALRKKGVHCEVKDIFEYRTIEQLASYVQTLLHPLPALTRHSKAETVSFTEYFVNQVMRHGNADYICCDDYVPYEIIDKQNAKSPLFIFPPGGGGAESYYGSIVPELSGHASVFFNNLQVFVQQKDHDYGLSLTYEELASYYIELIKKLQKKGPYDLFGWSFGGTLAFEVARQLESQGASVRRLVLLDAYLNFQKAYYSVREQQPSLDIGLLPSSMHYKYQLPEQLILKNTRIILLKATRYYTGNFEFDDPRWDVLPEYDKTLFKQYIHICKYYTEHVGDNYLRFYVDEGKLSIVAIPCAHGDFIEHPNVIKTVVSILKND